MTASEKATIYTLLKTASDAAHGYASPKFAGAMPVFTDDVIAAETVSVSAEQQSANSAPATAVPPIPAHTTDNAGAQTPLTPTDAHHAAQTIAAPAQSTASTIHSIVQKIAACQRCVLAQSRTHVVPGEGVPHPIVVVVGEGPGQQEDQTGRPFVGPAGQLLDKMLASIGLSRTTNCFIANIVKCRPPNNRVPLPDEAAACESFLQAQIFALKPKMILCAGSTAAKNLLKTQNGVTRLRGQFYDWNGIPVAVTFHPSALLRDASQKRFAWEDLKMMRARLQAIAPEYQPT